MDGKDSYIAELLQQLEELKRQRARKIQQLKKLKKLSSYKEESIVDHTTEDISQHTSASKERQGSSEAKCSKCRLCLNSEDAPCIQCLTTEYKENKYQETSDGTSTTLQAKPTNSENRLNSCLKPDRNNDSKLVKGNLKQNMTVKTLKVTCDNSVVEPSSNSRALIKLNETLVSDTSQVYRKRRKRSTHSEGEPKQDDHKKIKLSREISSKKNSLNCSSSVKEGYFHRGFLCKGGLFSSFGMPNESDEKLQIADAVVDVVEDSLLHDMSCFLSSGLLGEEEEDACVAKKRILAGPETDQAKNEPDLKSTVNDGNVFLSGSFISAKINSQKKDEVKDSVETSYGSTLSKPVPQLEALVVNGDCVQSINPPLPLNGGIERVIDTFSHAVTPRCMHNSENVQTNDSEQLQNYRLYSDIGSQGDVEVEVSTPKLEKKIDFNKIHENTSNCLPGVNKADDNHHPSLLDSSDRMNMLDSITTGKHCNENSDVRVQGENVKDNETPDLIHSVHVESKHVEPENSLNCVPETSDLKGDPLLLEIEEIKNLFADDTLIFDDFECTSLEVADTMDDLLTKSCKNGAAVSPDEPIEFPTKRTSINVMDEVFTIPETEQLLNEPHCGITETSYDENVEHQDRVSGDSPAMEDFNKTSAASDVFEETQCDLLDQLQTIKDSVLLRAEDSLELGNFKNIPFVENETSELDETSDLEELHDPQQTFLKYVCCLHSDINEPVNDIKLAFFNNCSYIFIQHVTWIQVWRQEENRDWSKIFTHQVDNELTLQEICFTKNASHLVLVMLLSSDQVHCVQFLLFESEARVVKLMEHTHWLQNRRPNERVLLCGLGDLKFSTAHGKETFDVFLHVFSSLRDNPRLMMAALGSTTAMLHSLCSIEKLPNSLIGISSNRLYLWHLLEARLVTSVCLQLPDKLLALERCIWATVENDLVFSMAVCKAKDESSRSCHLLAINIASGFCEIAMTYSFLPSIESPRTSHLKTVYCEPFLAASCEDGGFLWSVMNEYCCAAFEAKDDVTSIGIGRDSGDTFLVAVGNEAGCVNCCSIKQSLEQN